MKKMYIKPIVESIEVQATSLMQAGSPGLNVNSGDPIPSGGGGD